MDSGQIKYRTEQAAGWILNLLFLGLLLFGGFLCFSAFRMKTNPSAAVGLLLISLTFLFGAARLFCRLYLPKLAENFADFLLMPRRFLKEAPLILTPFEGLIAAGEYPEAEAGLLPLLKQHPSDAGIVSLLAQIYEKNSEQEKRFALFRTFYERPDRKPNPENLMLALQYADLLAGYSLSDELVAFLEKETRSSLYSGNEKKTLSLRLESILTEKEPK